MCNPALWLAAAAAREDYENQKAANKRMQEQVNLSEDRNDRSNQKMIAANDKNLEQYVPETRLKSLDANQAKAEESITQSLINARDNQNENEIAAQGKVSSTYENAKAEDALNRTKAGADLAKMISKVRAPTTMQNDEQMANAETSTIMGTEAQHRGDMARASAYDIEQAGKINPKRQMVVGLLRGLSLAYGLGAGSTAGSAAGNSAGGSTAISSSSYGGAIA